MADPDFITNHPITRAAATNEHCCLNMKIQIATPGVVFRQAGQIRPVRVVAALQDWQTEATTKTQIEVLYG